MKTNQLVAASAAFAKFASTKIPHLSQVPEYRTLAELLKHHVTGAIERGEAEAIVGDPAPPLTDNQKHQAYLDYLNCFCTAQGFAEHYGLTEEQGIILIREGRKIHEASVAPKLFTVVTVSSNTNSFGLKSILLLAEDGEGWQILKSPYGGEELPEQGDTVQRVGERFKCGTYECPRKLPDTPGRRVLKLLAEVKGL